ncbi:hypothetical protein JCM24511_05105 [Saitozyma sp. JCM 24511]|nr:hypothetical protein JCM24511_05105 [Saitozyma sp. JCM 24511]
MSAWTRLVRFIGQDGQVYLGQPVNASIDVGLAVISGETVVANVIKGDIYSGTVSSKEVTIKKLLPPVTRDECSIIRCLGLNYMKHAQEANMAIPKDPILFIKPRTALAGPGELSVSKAAQDDQLDFETELALVIGKDALDVSEEEALDYVLGCFGKGFNESCPIGPVLIRAGEIDPDNLDLKGVLSGEVVQQSNTSDMIFNCRKAISFLSQGTTLEKGTIIQMGTPSGIGWARDPKRLIKDGEEMRIWFQGIGTLINTFKYL